LLFGFGECCSGAVAVIVVEVSVAVATAAEVVVEEVGGRTGKIVGGEKGLTVAGLGLEKKNGKQPAIEKGRKKRNNDKQFVFQNRRKRKKIKIKSTHILVSSNSGLSPNYPEYPFYIPLDD
jgi:hypothetical protein